MIPGQQTFSLKATGDTPEVISANLSHSYPVRLRALEPQGEGNSIRFFIIHLLSYCQGQFVLPGPGLAPRPFPVDHHVCTISITMAHWLLNQTICLTRFLNFFSTNHILTFLPPRPLPPSAFLPPHSSQLPTLAPGISFCRWSERNNSWVRLEVKHYKTLTQSQLLLGTTFYEEEMK